MTLGFQQIYKKNALLNNHALDKSGVAGFWGYGFLHKTNLPQVGVCDTFFVTLFDNTGLLLAAETIQTLSSQALIHTLSQMET